MLLATQYCRQESKAKQKPIDILDNVKNTKVTLCGRLFLWPLNCKFPPPDCKFPAAAAPAALVEPVPAGAAAKANGGLGLGASAAPLLLPPADR